MTLVESSGEAVLATVGGLSLLRFTLRRIYWVHEHRKMLVKVQATRRGYNIARSQPKTTQPRYTIPDDEGH